MVNGKFKTHKIAALYKLIEWYKVKGLTLDLLPKCTIPLNSFSWLAGFIESDGHFSIRATKKGAYPKVECKFELSQALFFQNSIHGNSYKIMKQISEYLCAPIFIFSFHFFLCFADKKKRKKKEKKKHKRN